MRSVALVALAAALLAAPGADAARKKGRRDTLNVAVLPFEGRGAGGSQVKDAIELELELIENAAVTDSTGIEKDLERAGRDADDHEVISELMKKRGIDVLVSGSRAPGDRAADALVVMALAQDGKPHWTYELPLGSNADVAAAAITGSLKSALASWRTQKVVRLPGDSGSDRGLNPADVLMDDADIDAPPTGDRTPAGGGDVLEEDPIGRGEGDKPDGKKPKGGGLDFNDDDGEDPADTTRGSRLDEPGDDARRDRKDSTALDDDGRKPDSDVGDDLDTPAATERLGHLFAVTAAFVGSRWQYGFRGDVNVNNRTVEVASEVADPFHPGAGGRIDFWPIPYVGVEGDGMFTAMVFKFDDTNGATFNPPQFTVYQGSLGATLKARYVLSSGLPGFGIGGRLGYRFWGGTTVPQTLQPGGAAVTVVPGFTFHALAVGAEMYLPFIVAERRLEIDLRLDVLPATYYEEQPDNPGQSSLAFGWNGSLVARYALFGGFFVEAGGRTTGVSANYQNKPQRPRQTLSTANTPIPLEGGDVLNLMIGVDLGVGFVF